MIESLSNVGLEAYIFYKFFSQLNLQNTTARTIPTYLALYIFAFIYQIWLAIVAVGKRNIIQVLGLVVFNLAFLLYSAFQIKESHNVIFGRNAVRHGSTPLLIANEYIRTRRTMSFRTPRHYIVEQLGFNPTGKISGTKSFLF